MPNSPPTATNDTATTPPSGVVTIPILTNDTDAETPGALTPALTGLPSSGSAILNADGTVSHTAAPGFTGVVTIPYNVCDPQGLCDDAVITVTVPNAPPTTVGEERTVAVNQSVTVPVGANDSDRNGDPVTVTGIVTLPANGTATLNPDGTITYTPNLNFTGTDTVFYEVCDDDTPPACSVATLTIDVVNQPPQAVADAFRAPHLAGQPTTVSLTGLLDNDTDPDGQPLTISNFTQPTDGTVTQNPDGTLTYTAPPGFVGVAVFTYEVTDGSGGASRTTVVIEVGNEPPVATDDSATTPAGTAVSINVRGNDTDPDGDLLTVTEVTPAANGSVTIGADGSIVYTPNPGFTGTDTFTYTVCDPYGLCDVAVVTVTVTAGPGPTPSPTPTTPAPPAPSPQPGPPLASTGLAGGGLVPWVVGLLLTGIGLTALSRRRLRGHRAGPTGPDA